MNEKRLQKVKAALAKVATGEMLSRDAQKASGVSPTTFYIIKRALNVKRPDGVRKQWHEAAEKVRKARLTAAIAVNEGRITFEEALALTGLQRRTMLVWIKRASGS